MPEEAMVRREDAEGVAAIVYRVGLFVQAVGGEEDVDTVASGDVVFGVEVNGLVGYEGEVEDFGA